MGKKILKIVLWVFVGIVGLLLLVSVLVYISPVQAFIKNKAAQIVSNATGMELSIERFRLRFPLTVTVDNTILITEPGDTLLRAGKLSAGVAVWPLLAGEVRVPRLTVEDASVHYVDTLSNMVLRASLQELELRSAGLGLSDSQVDISGVSLDRARIDLSLGESHKPDTINVDTVPALWKIKLDKIEVADLDFRMHTHPHVTELTANLPQGEIRKVDFDLGGQRVAVGTIDLQQGKYAYLTDTLTVVPAPVVLESDAVSASAKPWTISLDRLDLADNAFDYGILNGEPKPGLDFDHLQLSGINVRVDSVYYRESDIRAAIRQLTAEERSGLAVTATEGRFVMDSTQIRLNDFSLRTAHSSLRADATIATGLLEQNPDAPVSAVLQAEVAPADLYLLFTPDPALRQTLTGQTLRIDGDVSGTLSQLDISTLQASMPGHIDFRANGSVSHLLEPDRLGGNLRLNGTFSRLDFIRPMLPDSLRERIAFPERMTLAGSVSVAGSSYAPDLRLTADSGLLAVKGRLDLKRESYDADLSIQQFPLNAFLPKDSLGIVSLDLTARGQSFDPRKEGASADIDLNIHRFDYKNYTLDSIRLAAMLHEHLLNGTLASDNNAAQLRFDLTGELRPEKYAGHLVGRIDTLDLHRIGLMAEPFEAGLYLDAQLTAFPDTTFRADLLIDTIRIKHAYHVDRIGKTTLTASADPRNITAAVRNGDLTVDFNAPVSVDSLLGSFTRASQQITAQIDSVSLNLALIEQTLPPFRLDASAKRNNFLHTYLESQGINFGSIDLMATTMGEEQPLRVGMLINSLKTGSLTLDTLYVGAARQDEQLNYFLRLANRPGNIEQLALIAVYGNVVQNRAVANILQRNRADSVGFRFGLEAELLDSAIRARVTPENPVLGYIPWTANADNYVLYRFDKFLEADLRLEGPDSKHIYITSTPLEPSLPTGAIKLDMKGIDIAHMLELLPTAPPIGGSLNTALGVGFDRGQLVSRGTVGVDDLVYQGNRVGSIGLDLNFQSDSLNRFMLDAAATVDGQSVLKAGGTYLVGDGSLAFRATIPSFPLSVANAFLPAETAQMSGNLTGWLAVSGSTGNPVVNGELTFAQGRLNVPMIGTGFGLSDRPILISGSRLDLNRFGLVSPDNQSLTLNGTVDFSDLSRLTTDLALTARQFDVINSQRSGGSQIYGKALLNANITARGVVNALTVRGDVGLLNGTDVTYTVREGPLKVENQEQNIVRFVDFNDPETFAPDSTARAQVFGIDMLVNVDIDDNVKATVNISEDGNNRVEVAGGGPLTLTMNTQGDTRFTGRYTIASGTVVYNPPVISQKNFAINDESYVEWTGEMMNPTFNIKADETLRTTVTEGDNNRSVTFIVSILIRNSLENVDLSFDVSAPNDIDIANQLATLAPEQRSQQAMALLVYNTYTGPGTTATVDTNNPLNSFIAKELNQWARNNLQGVDLSLGIDSVDDGAGGTHTDYSYQVSKSFMNDRIKVTIGGSINSDASADQNLQNNFVDDISVEYRLTERDNMFLKAFRHNTQESMLESEVVETGGGFLVRKKMNRLNELFKLAPKEQRRARRQIKRDMREQRRQAEAKSGVDPAKEQSQETPLDEAEENQPAI